MGIDIDRMIVKTLYSRRDGRGSRRYFLRFNVQAGSFFYGFIPGIKRAFTAAVLGGIGNIPGANVRGDFSRVALNR